LRGDYAGRQEEEVDDIMAQTIFERSPEIVQEDNLAGRMGKKSDFGEQKS